MRIASYSVPKAAQESENGDVSISYFGAGAGGTVEANLSRWIGQFSDVDPKSIERKTRTVAGYEQHLLEILGGSYSSMMSPTPMKDFGMLGAVVETESGSYFFKLIGPKTLVERSRTDFYKLLDSVHQSEKSGH